ncbi:hypothetical protein [Rosistilla oblonga]|uniref:hypothetical protein n=1 Tax=Rosistilla oblonga TaxID=2527990 RepID=UPI003A96E9D2
MFKRMRRFMGWQSEVHGNNVWGNGNTVHHVEADLEVRGRILATSFARLESEIVASDIPDAKAEHVLSELTRFHDAIDAMHPGEIMSARARVRGDVFDIEE